MHKITLIDPGFLGEYGIGKWGKSYWATAINHGIAQISAVCKSNGWNCYLIDFRKLRSYEDFEMKIKEAESVWYGITCRTIDFPIVEKVIKILKKVRPESKIVVGGIHPSLSPDDFLKNDMVDYVFSGEAENTLPLLLKRPENFPRLVQGDIPDINNIPFEDIDIYDYKTSISFSLYGGIIKPPTIPTITSRGCVYNCKFCQPAERILYGKKYRQKTVERVLDELKYINNRFNFNSIMFYDDCLLAHKKFLYELLTKFSKVKKIEFMLQGRVNNICQLGDEIADLKEIGLKAVIIGFESGSSRILDFIGKGTTVEQNIRASEILHKYGIKIVGNYMIGLPTETNVEIQETINLAKKIKATISSCSFYSPMPGSYLYDYCKENDLIIEKDYAKLSRDPKKAKIKGVDYDFVSQALSEILGSRFKNKLFGKIIGYAYKNLERGYLREVLTKVYNKIVK